MVTLRLFALVMLAAALAGAQGVVYVPSAAPSRQATGGGAAPGASPVRPDPLGPELLPAITPVDWVCLAGWSCSVGEFDHNADGSLAMIQA